MIIEFKPIFKHTDWVDNQDRVTAGGENGFNGRFQNIAKDFGTLSQVVSDLLDLLNTQLKNRPPVKVLLDTSVTIAAGGTIKFGLGTFPLGVHVFFLVSVFPDPHADPVGSQVTWEEATTAAPLPPSTDLQQFRNLVLTNPATNQVTVGLKVLQIDDLN